MFEGAILVIIDKETWHNVQRLRETMRRTPKRRNAPNRLTGLLYCADCELTHRCNLVADKWLDDAFVCSSYRQLTRDCTMHHIPTQKIEADLSKWQAQIDTWKVDNFKTDRFLELVKRYTDFSELTTAMLNEFVEKVIVHEGVGRGKERRQRLDIYLNFIGAFEVPAHIVTPMGQEEERRLQEEQAADEERRAKRRTWQK